MRLKEVEEHIELLQKNRVSLLKSDTSIDANIEENLEKKYRIKPLEGGRFLFYHDKKKDRALIVQLELNHLMDKIIFTKCLPKKWDTGKKTSKKHREKIVNRIENYYKKYFNKVIFQ